jgi:hypothetical protein
VANKAPKAAVYPSRAHYNVTTLRFVRLFLYPANRNAVRVDELIMAPFFPPALRVCIDPLNFAPQLYRIHDN